MKVPPHGQLKTEVRIERVSNGWTITVNIRTLHTDEINKGAALTFAKLALERARKKLGHEESE